MHDNISITYVPTGTDKIAEYVFDQEEIYLKQDFLQGVDPEFLSLTLSHTYNKHIPIHVSEAIIAYAHQHIILRDITVVFDYDCE